MMVVNHHTLLNNFKGNNVLDNYTITFLIETFNDMLPVRTTQSSFRLDNFHFTGKIKQNIHFCTEIQYFQHKVYFSQNHKIQKMHYTIHISKVHLHIIAVNLFQFLAIISQERTKVITVTHYYYTRQQIKLPQTKHNYIN